MNKAILIVICDFLVSAMLTMMTGMVPGHTGGTGVGLDESTTKVLLSELNRRQIELEVMRAKLMEAFARSGSTPEQEAELRRITEELARNMLQQDKLRTQLSISPGDGMDSAELKIRLEEESQKRKELELTLADTRKELDAKLRILEDNSVELRDRERDNAVLSHELSRTRHSLEQTGMALDNTRRDLQREQDRHGITREKLAASETARDAAVASAALSNADAVRARRELGDARKELLDETRSHRDTQTRLATAEAERDAANARADSNQAALANANAELTATRQQRDEARSAGSEANTRLATANSELRNLRRDLSNSQADLRNLESANTQMESERNRLTLTLTEVRTVATTREKDLAELRDELNRERQRLLVERLKRQEAETRTAMTEEAYKELVQHNSKTQQENTRLIQENARITAENTGNNQNNGNSSSNRQNSGLTFLAPVTVFDNYAKAILRVENLITEKKLIGERGEKLASFYPAVDFGSNRIMITGASHRFAGDWQDALKFIDVNQVDIKFASFLDNQLTPVNGNMLISRTMPHLAGFPVQLPQTCQPLKPVTIDDLRKRGVEDLYLFRCHTPDDQTRLSGRVSISAVNGNLPHLIIRNAGMSVKAAYGDLILTAQGEFVGIVSDTVKVDGARTANAVKVPLITSVDAMWEQPWMIPLEKNPQEDFFSSFANKMREFRSNVKSRHNL